ncbi:peptide ABC transporter substrate-binding protein [Candidatus Kaiserbacteria bacterium]|nr:peptide ABC transporter substrate-binding protein [Candidatus Kaiserbacteria bacterium]
MEESYSHSPETTPQESPLPPVRTGEQYPFAGKASISWRRFEYLSQLMRQFSPSERLALYIFSGLIALSTFILIVHLSDTMLVTIPKYGGSFVEGEIGPARFVNPVLAISGPDKDMTELIYSGLMRAMPNGSMVPDLAESYSISEDGTTYTFKMRSDATFQDGTPVTSEDVAFTIRATQNSALKSPRQADWVGVTITTPDARTVVFKLPHAYTPFMEDTTMGILPKHLWDGISDQDFAYNALNTHPIGSGPYMIDRVNTDKTGSVTRYDLKPFSHFTLGKAHIATISLVFYPNTDALNKAFLGGSVDAIAGVDPSDVAILKDRKDAALAKSILPRVFGVFFNQSHNPALVDLAARKALDAAVDKQALVRNALQDYGAVLDGPIPQGIFGDVSPATPSTEALKEAGIAPTSTTSDSRHTEEARTILQNGGWKFNTETNTWEKGKLTLHFTLATADEPELVATAHAVAADWQAAGITVDVYVYPISDFNSTILRPRNYDAILFGEVVGRSADLFAFWDSSQRNDPGLNLSMYANSQASSLLTKARSTHDDKDRKAIYQQFTTILKKDVPAVFLYSPAFVYILPASLHGVETGAITTPAERFLNVYQWYTETERVWSIFASANTQI